MSAFTISSTAVTASAFSAVRTSTVARRTAAPRSAIKAKYSVTLDGPDGKTVIECADDTYILDAAEVRVCARRRRPRMGRMNWMYFV
jgi:hypothetical protein